MGKDGEATQPSKYLPYQTLQTDLPLQCSLEFHQLWILGCNNGSFGAIIILKPDFGKQGVDIQFTVAEKATQFGAVSALCPMLHGGTHILTGTL